jgi:hypothetical protein
VPDCRALAGLEFDLDQKKFFLVLRGRQKNGFVYLLSEPRHQGELFT